MLNGGVEFFLLGRKKGVGAFEQLLELAEERIGGVELVEFCLALRVAEDDAPLFQAGEGVLQRCQRGF